MRGIGLYLFCSKKCFDCYEVDYVKIFACVAGLLCSFCKGKRLGPGSSAARVFSSFIE